MVDFGTFESNGQDTVLDIDVFVWVQVFIYGYFDMRNKFRLFVIEVDHPVELDGTEVGDRYFLGRELSVSFHMICCLGREKHSH